MLLSLALAAPSAPPASATAAPPATGGRAVSHAQSAAPPGGAQASSYIIGVHDVLNVTVFGETDLSGQYRVDSDGTITYPLLGRVAASGLTSRGLEQRLSTLLENGYLKHPQIRVEVEQYRSQSIFVIGEVRQPGRYPLTGDMTLIEALAAAGSVNGTAGNEVLVVHSTRTTPPSGPVVPGVDQTAQVTHVDLEDLQTGQLPNVVLHDGDTIFVPKAQTFYITGQVKNPGAYVLRSDMTVLQAVSLAGGLTDRGSDRRIKIVRFVKGVKHEVDVKLTDRVQPGDTIVVPQRFF